MQCRVVRPWLVRARMQVKLLERAGDAPISVAQFLNKAVEAPPAQAVANAVRLLQDIGAFEAGSEVLTVRA